MVGMSKKEWKPPLERELRVRGKRGILFLSRPSKLSLILGSIASVGLILGLLFSSVPIVPMVWYRLQPETSQALAQVLGEAAQEEAQEVVVEPQPEQAYQPPVDASLPQENRISIPKIGVDTAILEAPYEEYESALRQGVWRSPDMGTPFEREKPTVLVAHRFGYLAWSNAYRRENSFFNLPKLEEGDRVEVVWGQRKYVYEVYFTEENTEITRGDADLILYTCKFLQSPVRIFVYGRLVENE